MGVTPTLLGIEGQPIDPNEPEPPLALNPPDAPIEQPPAGIHLAIMAQVGPQAPVAFEKAKGKEGFLHRVVYHVASFIESEVYV